MQTKFSASPRQRTGMRHIFKLMMIVTLVASGRLYAQSVDQPPQLRFIQDASSMSGTGLADQITFKLPSTGNGVAGGSVGYSATDADSGSAGVTLTVGLSGSAGGSVNFNNQGFVTPGGANYTLTAAIASISNVLSSMSFQSNVPGFWTISITVNDNGNTGSCSATDPNPCPKIATATLAVDVYKGTRDRIFLNGFDPQ